MSEFVSKPVTVAGKTAVVIGGTSGIGEGIALAFADDGADVVASSRSAERVASTAAELRDRGAETVELTCDVTERDTLRTLRDRTLDEFGTVDVVVTSAAAVARSAVEDVDEAEWDAVLDVQLDGVFRAIQVFAREMDDGSIVNVSSIAATDPAARRVAYSTAKGGVEALTRSAAKDLAPDVRVNAIAPGFVVTPMNREQYGEGTERRRLVEDRAPMSRVAERGEIAGAAVYLASDAASYTTGEVLTVDGGFTWSVF